MGSPSIFTSKNTRLLDPDAAALLTATASDSSAPAACTLPSAGYKHAAAASERSCLRSVTVAV